MNKFAQFSIGTPIPASPSMIPQSGDYNPLYAIVAALQQQQHAAIPRPTVGGSPFMAHQQQLEIDRMRSNFAQPPPHHRLPQPPFPPASGGNPSVASELRHSLHAYQTALAAAAERAREEQEAQRRSQREREQQRMLRRAIDGERQGGGGRIRSASGAVEKASGGIGIPI